MSEDCKVKWCNNQFTLLGSRVYGDVEQKNEVQMLEFKVVSLGEFSICLTLEYFFIAMIISLVSQSYHVSNGLSSSKGIDNS